MNTKYICETISIIWFPILKFSVYKSSYSKWTFCFLMPPWVAELGIFPCSSAKIFMNVPLSSKSGIFTCSCGQVFVPLEFFIILYFFFFCSFWVFHNLVLFLQYFFNKSFLFSFFHNFSWCLSLRTNLLEVSQPYSFAR